MSEAPTNPPATLTCEGCSAPADVHVSILEGGVARMRHFCVDCEEAFEEHSRSRRRRSGDAAVVIVVGALTLLMSLFADALRLGGTEGFGSFQMAGVLIGCLLSLLGAVARARTLLILGVILLSQSLLADWLALGNAEGYGVHQAIGSAGGMLIIIVGVVLVRRSR